MKSIGFFALMTVLLFSCEVNTKTEVNQESKTQEMKVETFADQEIARHGVMILEAYYNLGFAGR